MKERIEELHTLFSAGIDRQLFFRLLLNIANGGFMEGQSSYANYLKIDIWMELYANKNIKINVSKEQLVIFLDYLVKYANGSVGRNGEYYYVTKDFSNDRRGEENFNFESIVFQVFETVM